MGLKGGRVDVYLAIKGRVLPGVASRLMHPVLQKCACYVVVCYTAQVQPAPGLPFGI